MKREDRRRTTLHLTDAQLAAVIALIDYECPDESTLDEVRALCAEARRSLTTEHARLEARRARRLERRAALHEEMTPDLGLRNAGW